MGRNDVTAPTGSHTIPDGFEPGKLIAGTYRVESTLGRGGMGVVLRARHEPTDRVVALKVARDDVELDKETQARFLREARAVRALESRHVTRIFEVGQLEDGRPYMAMELLEGYDLADLIARGPLDPARAIALIQQACDALAEAHAHGIVHRDLKPSNLMVARTDDAPEPILKVLDFGIAKAPHGLEIASLTQSAVILGTPAYMSPEQMRSARRVDARSDIWALGVVLYELVEGHRPFDAQTFADLCVIASTQPTPPLVTCRVLSPVIMRCLAKLPEQRYQTIAELSDALVCVDLVETPDKVPQSGPPTRLWRTPPRGQPWLVATLIVAILAVAAGIVLVATSR